jgi:hypothetical protein
MARSSPRRLVLALGLAAAAGGGAAWWWGQPPAPARFSARPLPALTAPRAADGHTASTTPAEALPRPDELAAHAELAARLRERFRQPGLRPDETLLTFKDQDAYQRFLGRARDSGLEVLGGLPPLLTVRVRIGDYGRLVGELDAHLGDYATIAANPILAAPAPPPEEREARAAEPVGERLLETLGLAPGTDTAAWGRGVLVAVLDGGASPDPTLGARLRYQDIGYGTTGFGEDGAHGTAVASLVAGSAPGARGVAPAADLLSIRVTGADGRSDAFSVAQGILAALDSGARVINISLGGHATSPVLGEAIERALARGVAVVASSGNDQAGRLAWPAAHEGVVSVGATDARGVQAIFSNSGDTLQLTAPGYGLRTAGLSGTRVDFSGTSASAPVVSGAIAALLSQSPSLTPVQAADLLATHSNDGGAAGADPDYGRGTLNLGWALGRDDPARSDPALSSVGYRADEDSLVVVVQNRGSRAITGLRLALELGGARSEHALAALPAAASTTVRLPVDRSRLAREGRLTVTARLLLPAGLVDLHPENNRLGGVVTAP